MKKLALLALVVLAFPAAASAKGPSAAAISGPGLTTIRVSGREGGTTPFWRLTEATGWFEAVYGPPSLPRTPPPGELGPRYTITWTVPEAGILHQDVYPYAKPSPLTYMPRKGKIYGSPVRGGWFAGGAKLKRALVLVGVPAAAPAPPRKAVGVPQQRPSGSDLSDLDIGAITAGSLILVLALTVGVRAWRKPRRTIPA